MVSRIKRKYSTLKRSGITRKGRNISKKFFEERQERSLNSFVWYILNFEFSNVNFSWLILYSNFIY